MTDQNKEFDNVTSNTLVSVVGTAVRTIERAVVVFWDGLRSATEHGTPSLLGFVSAFLPILMPMPIATMTANSLERYLGWDNWQAVVMAIALEGAGFVLWVTLTETLMRDSWQGTVMQYFFGVAAIIYQLLLIAINTVLAWEDGVSQNYVATLFLMSFLPALSSIAYGYRNQGNEQRLEEQKREQAEREYQIRQEKRQDRKELQALRSYAVDVQTGFTGVHRAKIEKVCPGCGNKFWTTSPDKVTCSDRCRKRISRSKSKNVA